MEYIEIKLIFINQNQTSRMFRKKKKKFIYHSAQSKALQTLLFSLERKKRIRERKSNHVLFQVKPTSEWSNSKIAF